MLISHSAAYQRLCLYRFGSVDILAQIPCVDTTKCNEKPRPATASFVGEGRYANEHVNNFGRLDESEGEAQTCRDRLSGRSEVESGGDYCADAVRFC
jgi:hypothetical protein